MKCTLCASKGLWRLRKRFTSLWKESRNCFSSLGFSMGWYRSETCQPGEGRVKLQELSKKYKSIEWENELQAPKHTGFYRGKLGLTTPRTSMLLLFYRRKTCKFLLQQWDYQKSSVLVWPGGPWESGQFPGTAACSQQSQQHGQPAALPSLAVHSSIPGALGAWQLLSWCAHPLGNRPAALTVPKLSLQTLIQHWQLSLCLHTASYIPCQF